MSRQDKSLQLHVALVAMKSLTTIKNWHILLTCLLTCMLQYVQPNHTTLYNTVNQRHILVTNETEIGLQWSKFLRLSGWPAGMVLLILSSQWNKSSFTDWSPFQSLRRVPSNTKGLSTQICWIPCTQHLLVFCRQTMAWPFTTGKENKWLKHSSSAQHSTSPKILWVH